MGLSAGVRRQLSTARLMDMLEGSATSTLNRLTERPGDGSSFACQSYSLRDATLVMLSGRVNRDALRAMGFIECMTHSVRDRHCIIDFRNVDLLESSGIAELMPLLMMHGNGNSQVMLSGVGYAIRQMLRMADVKTTAVFMDDRQLLQRIREENRHD
jgi:ABC-type transporter Mla MlaB component